MVGFCKSSNRSKLFITKFARTVVGTTSENVHNGHAPGAGDGHGRGAMTNYSRISGSKLLL